MTVEIALSYTDEQLQVAVDEFMAQHELHKSSASAVKAALVRAIQSRLEAELSDMLTDTTTVFKRLSHVEKFSATEFEYAADHPEEVILIAA